MQTQTRSSSRRVWTRRLVGGALAGAVAVGLPGCTTAQRADESSSILIIDALKAASGAEPDKLGGVLASDVQTGGGIFADNLEATFRLALKDPGSTTNPSQPSTTNYITVTRYSVRFVRSDGRNTPGVDVPWAFDGGMTATVTETGAVATGTLVRVQAKVEAPLMALRNLGGAVTISTIAEVTFYGTDQAGRAVTAVGRISVNFADWADPE
jgi:hypothetical protein